MARTRGTHATNARRDSGNNQAADGNTPGNVNTDAAGFDGDADGIAQGAGGSEPEDAGNTDGFVDPGTADGDGTGAGVGDGDSGGGRKRRGRKPGSRNRSKASTSQTTDALASMLFTVHSFASKIFKAELLALDEEESKRLANAAVQVTQLYDIPLLDEKSRAWLNLGMVAADVYGTRFMAATIMAKKNKAASVNGPQVVEGTFHPFTQTGVNGEV